MSVFDLFWLIFAALALPTSVVALEITPHRFTEYPAERIFQLHDKLEIDNITLLNCSGCETIAVPDYVIEGMIRLVEMQASEFHNSDYFHPNYGNVEVRDWPLQQKELAVVVDYHLNYSHVFSYQRSGDQLELKIDKSYAVSNGTGGMVDRRRSGGTPGGVHFVYFKQNMSADENEIVYAKDTRLIGKVLTPTLDDYWWDTALISARRLRLAGLEKINENSVERSILLHGTPEEGFLGMHKSGGCIRFSNHSIVAISEQLHHGALVNIVGDTKDMLNDGDIAYANNRAKK